MSEQRSSDHYQPLAIALHWLILALIVAAYTLILMRENFERGTDIREGLKTWHYMVGLTVLTLATLRLVLNAFVWKRPPITPPPPAWQTWLAAGVHIALYVLMIGMPIAGWLMLSADGATIPFWGLQLPPLIAADEALADQIKALHETGGTIGYFLIGAHAAAALAHHYLFKDNTLLRMLPGSR